MLVLTSSLFVTNTAHAIIRGAWFYAAAFLALVFTSWWYHYTGEYNDDLAFLCDQGAILAIVLIGLYYSLQLPSHLLWIAFGLFLTVCVAYYFGCNHAIVQLLCMASHHTIMAGII
jgi:hypothetical protein